LNLSQKMMTIWRNNPYLASFVIAIVVVPILGFSIYAIVASHNNRVLRQTVRLETMLRQAKDAKLHGDSARALKLIDQIRQADPTWQPVVVAQVAVGLNTNVLPNGTSGGTGAGGNTRTPPAVPPGQSPLYSGSLAGLFPKSLTGYTMINDAPGTLSASRMYQADKAAHPKVYILTIQFSRSGSDEGAAAYINNNVKNYYAAGGRTITVRNQAAFFGTDGGKLAILAYPSGGIAVELEMSTASGSPADLYDDLIALSKLVP
jgi:hypothetical protein